MYSVKSIQASEEGDTLQLNRMLGSYFDESHNDVYCMVDVQVDPKKHVKPIEVKPKASVNGAASKSNGAALNGIYTADKFVTLTKYSFYESGKNWVKVLFDLKDIKSHNKDKIIIDFTNRSFTLKVLDYKG